MPRSLSIFFPDRKTEYWFTDRVFGVGDTFERNGSTWIVTSVGETDAGNKHTTVTVRPDEDGRFVKPSS